MHPSHLVRIDALRGVAILGVFFFHSQEFLFPRYSNQLVYFDGFLHVTDFRSFLLNFNPFAFGASGVTLFLIISGFLIHLGFLHSGKLNVSKFYSKRFWRIYPPYLLILVAVYIFVTGIDSDMWSNYYVLHFGLHALLIHNLWDPSFFSINPSLWSLGLEVQFYLIYPVFIIVRNKIGITKTFLVVVAVAVISFAIGRIYPSLGRSVAWINSVPQTWYIWCAGALLAERYAHNKKIFGDRPAWFIFGSLIAVFVSLFVQHLSWIRGIPIFLFLLSITEWTIHFKATSPSNFSRSAYKALVFVGISSYSLYLIHQPVIMVVVNYSKNNFPSLSVPVLLMTFGVVLAVSYVLYRLVEQPSIDLGKRLRKETRSI